MKQGILLTTTEKFIALSKEIEFNENKKSFNFNKEKKLIRYF